MEVGLWLQGLTMERIRQPLVWVLPLRVVRARPWSCYTLADLSRLFYKVGIKIITLYQPRGVVRDPALF